MPFSIERVSSYFSQRWRQELNKTFRNVFLSLGSYDYTIYT